MRNEKWNETTYVLLKFPRGWLLGAVEGENQALGPNPHNNSIWVPLPSVKKQYNFYNVIHINYSSWVRWQFFLGYFEAAILIALSSNFLLPQANGHTCVDFGCTHPIDGLFWSLPIYLLGFFSKYECFVTNLIRPLHHFNFWVYTCLFVSQGFISL